MELKMKLLALVAISSLLILGACGGGSGGTVAAITNGSPARYVALGDSYSSGHGTVPKPDTSRCSRTQYAYPELWIQKHAVADFTFVACQGAVMANVTDTAQTAQGETQPQIAAISSATNMVTITIGGNDTGFADIATSCAESEIFNRDTKACMAKVQQISDIVAGTAFAGNLLKTYRAVRAAASPDARIFVLGYPQFYYLPQDAIGPKTRAQVDALMLAMDAVIRTAADTAGVTYVDVDSYFTGHGAGKQNPNAQWINDITFSDIHVSLHPNIDGHALGDLPALEAATGG